MHTTIINNQPIARVKKPADRSGWVLTYTSAIALVGLVAAVYAWHHLPEDKAGLLIFIVLGVIAELTSMERFINSHSWVSVSSIVVIASIATLGPSAGVLVYIASGLTTGITTSLGKMNASKGRASLLQRTSFNCGMWAMTAMTAGAVYLLAGGIPGSVARIQTIPALTALAFSEWFLNAVLLTVVISLQTEQRISEIWKRDFIWQAPVSILGGIVGGGFLAFSFDRQGIIGILIILLPILSIGYSFRVYKNNMKGYVENLENLNNELQEVNIDLLETLSGVIDAYDIYTYGHSRQVTTYAQAIAEKMGLSRDEQTILVKAALLHDIGKVGITDNIISKEGRLTEQEYQIIKRHSNIGAEIVGRMKGLRDLVPLIRSHHERWDGRGYPDGLAREEIPLGARILSVADTLDVIISDRPYRSTRTFREAMEEMEKCTGTQFDPAVIKALFSVAVEKGPTFFKNSASTVDHTVPLKDKSPTIPRFLKKSMMN